MRERVDKIYSILDYSYRSKQNAGDGFMLIGDAYGFLDPIYSSGVLLALKMAELAADAIHDAFKHDDFSAERLGQFQTQTRSGHRVDAQARLRFLQRWIQLREVPAEVSRARVNIINLLIGDVFREGVDEVYGPMSEFAEIPPPLYEQVHGSAGESDEATNGAAVEATQETPEEPLTAKYIYYEDRDNAGVRRSRLNRQRAGEAGLAHTIFGTASSRFHSGIVDCTQPRCR